MAAWVSARVRPWANSSRRARPAASVPGHDPCDHDVARRRHVPAQRVIPAGRVRAVAGQAHHGLAAGERPARLRPVAHRVRRERQAVGRALLERHERGERRRLHAGEDAGADVRVVGAERRARVQARVVPGRVVEGRGRVRWRTWCAGCRGSSGTTPTSRRRTRRGPPSCARSGCRSGARAPPAAAPRRGRRPPPPSARTRRLRGAGTRRPPRPASGPRAARRRTSPRRRWALPRSGWRRSRRAGSARADRGS